MNRRCRVCEGPTHNALYWAPLDQDLHRLIALPAKECFACGAIEPDAGVLLTMIEDVPLDVLRQCFEHQRVHPHERRSFHLVKRAPASSHSVAFDD